MAIIFRMEQEVSRILDGSVNTKIPAWLERVANELMTREIHGRQQLLGSSQCEVKLRLPKTPTLTTFMLRSHVRYLAGIVLAISL